MIVETMAQHASWKGGGSVPNDNDNSSNGVGHEQDLVDTEAATHAVVPPSSTPPSAPQETVSTTPLHPEEETRRRRSRSGSRDMGAEEEAEAAASRSPSSADPGPVAAPMSWESQGSSLQPEYVNGHGGGGDSSDTLGDDSDEEVLEDEEEMAVALAAAAAVTAIVDGGTGCSALNIAAAMVTNNHSLPVSRAPSPTGAASSAAGLSTVHELEASSSAGAVPSLSCSRSMSLGGRLVLPSILPHTEALLAIRERSQQLYVPLPAAISRTFGEENNSMIDRRAWLEVEDRKHRYAKNLRLYYKEWDRQGQPGPSFWAWLDEDSVELEDCSRAQLEAETVHYCASSEERLVYEVQFREAGLLHRRQDSEWARVNTGPDGWIFVLRDRIIYAHEKKTDQPPRFHHSSFFAGECVQAAGLFVAAEGVLERLYPHSGHYRPTDSHLLSLLLFLESQAVDMDAMQVDVQLVMKVARAHDANKGGRKRKIDSPYMWTGLHAKYFLLAKRYAWEHKLFEQLFKHPLVLHTT